MKPDEIKKKRVLFSALNWGMGHVSRSIGLVSQLIENDNTLFIACDENQKQIFQCYFPNVEYIQHEGYPFQFRGKGDFSGDFMRNWSKLSSRLKKEPIEVELLVDKHEIDTVISDHRYGFRSDKVSSVFITHQLNLPVKWYQKSIQAIHVRLLRKYHHIWVMDFADSRLAGELSRNKKSLPVEYIGPYSRFMNYDLPVVKNNTTVVIASGPLIYAQLFLGNQLNKSSPNDNVVVVAPKKVVSPNEILRISNNWLEQDQVILNAQKIISNTGYTTIMDLFFLKAECELYSTKGQSEQEYLFTLHGEKNK